jgi:hypothetical protein
MHRVHLLVPADLAAVGRELVRLSNPHVRSKSHARVGFRQCKHVLAVTLAEKTGRCQTIEMQREQISALLSST